MRVIVLISILLCAATVYGQQLAVSVVIQQPTTAATPAPKPFKKTLELLKQAKKEIEDAKTGGDPAKVTTAEGRFRRVIDINPLEWAEYLADPGMQAIRPFLSEAEQKRIDKQVGSGADANGTTSLVSKGSVPALFGLAVENGAATREINGTTITFRVNPTGLIKALVKQDYLTSGPAKITLPDTRTKNIRVEESDIWYRILNKASVAASFDISKGPNAGIFTAERSQLTSYSFHYDIINHRDPRDKKYQEEWRELRESAGGDNGVATALNLFAIAIDKMTDENGKNEYAEWRTETKIQLLAASTDELEDRLITRAEVLRELVNKHPDVVEIIKSQVIPAANRYAAKRLDLLNKVSKSLTAAFDYSNTRQVVTLGNTESEMITLPAGVTNGLPDLGTFLLTISGRFIHTSEITANISGTRFNGRRVGPNIGRWRDFRAGVQIDIPLPKLAGGTPALTFSYLYLNLLEEPLGAKVLVNGVEQSRKGHINFGQTKLELPIGTTGMRIPISMTFSNRTELIKESQVRGNIGITFDLDKIFSKNQ